MIDIAIVGGGPAGSAAARLLASWGHRVVLIDKRPPGVSLAESIPPSTRKLFDVFRIADAIDRAGFLAWRGNVVSWGRERRVEWFPGGVAGHHVVRRDFDHLLRMLAADQGVAVLEATVASVSIADDGARVFLGVEPGTVNPEPGTVNPEPGTQDLEPRTTRTPRTLNPARSADPEARTPQSDPRHAPQRTLDARFVLDCSGRTGVLARSLRLRSLDQGTRTIALAAIWRRSDGWRDLDATCAFIETYEDGWLWSIPVVADRRQVTVMIDPRTTDLERSGGAERVYRHEIAKASQFASFLRDAVLEGGPWGFDASLYTASCFHGPNVLLVGDAGSALDPLSSFGVKKALSSAWLASVAVHTALVRPAMREAAFAFYDTREREVYASYRRASREFAASAAAAHGHPFWMRSGPADADAIEGQDPVERLREDPEILRAFTAIRESPVLNLHRSPHARIEPRPGVAGREIVMHDCLVVDRFPEGVRYLRGVDLLRVIDLAPAHSDVGALFEAYTRSCAPVTLPDFLGALSVLVATGALEGTCEQ